MTLRQRLLTAVDSDAKKLQQFFVDVKEYVNESIVVKKSQQKLHDEKIAFHLTDVLQEFNKQQCVSMWKNVNFFCEEALRKFASNVHQSENPKDADLQNEVKEAVDILQNISILCLSYIRVDKPFVTDHLLTIVSILHGSLLNLSSFAPVLAQSICTLCVAWWSKELPSREGLCLNVFVHLLNEILGSGLTKQRTSAKLANQLYEIQLALKSLDLTQNKERTGQTGLELEENIQELRQLLASAFLHPVFLKSKNGRKFLCHVLLLHQDLMVVVHETIMTQISRRCNYSEAYGNIYYLAWNLAGDEYKEKLEECCIQDVMFRAIHAAHGKELFVAYRQILSSIAAHNGALPVRHMVTRLYNPIIWRTLKASNAMVRANAATLLFDTFPLVNPPEVNGEDRDAFLQKQFNVIDDLIMDPYPQIRSIAITGMFKILNLFWDVIPAQVIALMCKKLYTNLASDSTSVAVRLAVMKGTIVLLDNPRSHPLLQKLLPVTSCCIHDKSEKVRIAMCKVLAAVKQTSSIKYWDICYVENLLAQLEVEGRTGSNHLVNLMNGSFLPQNQPMKTWVERCVNFYERNAGAARKFYLHAKDHLSVTELGEFIFSLSVFVFNVVSKSLEDQAQEQVHSEEQSLTAAEQPGLIAGLVETICITWMEFCKKTPSLSKPKSERAGSNEVRELTKKVMIQLPRMSHVCFRKYNDQRTLNALLHLSSCLHPASMPIFSNKVIPKLRDLPEDSASKYYEMLIKCVVKWGWCTQLMEVINGWMVPVDRSKKDDNNGQKVETTNKPTKSGKKPKQKKKKQVQFVEELPPARPSLAVKYLSVLLDNEESSRVMLSDPACRKLTDEILLSLQMFTTKLFKSSSSIELDDLSEQTFVDSLQLHFQLLAKLYLFYKDENSSSSEISNSYLERLSSLIECTQVKVIEELKSTVQATDIQNSSILSTTVFSQSQSSSNSSLPNFNTLKILLQRIFDSMILLLRQGIPLCDRALAFVSAFTDIGIKTLDYVGAVCEVMREIVECSLLYAWSRDDDNKVKSSIPFDNESKIFCVIDDVIMTLIMYSRSNGEGFSAMFRTQVRSAFRSILSMTSKYSLSASFYSSFVNRILSSVLADITHHKLSNSELQFRPCDKYSDLSNFSAAFLPVLCSTAAECEYVCQHTLPNMFATSSSTRDKERLLALQSCVFMLEVMIKDGKNSSAVKSCQEVMKQKLHDYVTPDMNQSQNSQQ